MQDTPEKSTRFWFFTKDKHKSPSVHSTWGKHWFDWIRQTHNAKANLGLVLRKKILGVCSFDTLLETQTETLGNIVLSSLFSLISTCTRWKNFTSELRISVVLHHCRFGFDPSSLHNSSFFFFSSKPATKNHIKSTLSSSQAGFVQILWLNSQWKKSNFAFWISTSKRLQSAIPLFARRVSYS